MVSTHPVRMIPLYSRVALVTDKYANEGGSIGMIGYVIETYHGSNYEVEFSDDKGVTIAQLVVDESEVCFTPEKSEATNRQRFVW
jgi:Domain of unknown function (DUF4926)